VTPRRPRRLQFVSKSFTARQQIVRIRAYRTVVRCERCHSELVRLAVVAADRSRSSELGVCLCCPKGFRYRELVPDRRRAS
jgi:hypothetical protein